MNERLASDAKQKPCKHTDILDPLYTWDLAYVLRSFTLKKQNSQINLQTTQRQMRTRKRAQGTERDLWCTNCGSAIAQVVFQISANRHHFRHVFFP